MPFGKYTDALILGLVILFFPLSCSSSPKPIRRAADRDFISFAGSGHSWKRGIPEIGKNLTRDKISPGDTDYLWTGL